MHKLLFSVLLGFLAITLNAQDIQRTSIANPIQRLDSIFQHLDLTQVPSGILLERGLSLMDPKPYNGTISAPSITMNNWRKLYAGMYRGNLLLNNALKHPADAWLPYTKQNHGA
jgi:hypothetical protein